MLQLVGQCFDTTLDDVGILLVHKRAEVIRHFAVFGTKQFASAGHDGLTAYLRRSVAHQLLEDIFIVFRILTVLKGRVASLGHEVLLEFHGFLVNSHLRVSQIHGLILLGGQRSFFRCGHHAYESLLSEGHAVEQSHSGTVVIGFCGL